MLFVSLPLSYIAKDSRYLDLVLEYQAGQGREPGLELGLELGLDACSLDTLPRSWHEDLTRTLRRAGLRIAVHLPFMDLSPGSPDDLILLASRQRLAAAFSLCRCYAPEHMVGHPTYYADVWGGNVQAWLERCAETWSALLRNWPERPPLHLENTFEGDPEPLALLVDALSDAGHAEVGACFDVGHWHSFAHGVRHQDMRRWVAALGPRITHLHLHDNDGSTDQHLGLGKGCIDFAELFRLLQEHGAAPAATMEPHTEEAFTVSLEYLKEHHAVFAPLLK